MGVGSSPPDWACVVHHGTNELLVEQHTIPDGEATPPLKKKGVAPCCMIHYINTTERLAALIKANCIKSVYVGKTKHPRPKDKSTTQLQIRSSVLSPFDKRNNLVRRIEPQDNHTQHTSSESNWTTQIHWSASKTTNNENQI
jgi:hypothetical protein